ncbi:hypothetical protein QT971_30665 [Microcoleus sp. herbarium19]|uniref:hypothetical protein n=1 Tax=Microcoleus sp. herbarium13 TaxID=3055438 RepID=UPI002FD20F99
MTEIHLVKLNTNPCNLGHLPLSVDRPKLQSFRISARCSPLGKAIPEAVTGKRKINPKHGAAD